MASRSHPYQAVVVVLLAVGSLLAASPTLASPPRGLYGPAGAREAATITYLQMRETTSLRPDGSGEERIEFLVLNSGATSLSTAEFLFHVGSTQYWGIEAFDEQGSIGHTIVVNADEVHVTLQFRQPVAAGAQYRYTFVINFPGLAERDGNEWAFGWATYFPVVEFVRTVYLPGGGALTYAAPPPDTQTAGLVRWTRYAITQFTLSLRYTLGRLSDQDLAEEYAPSFRIHSSDAYAPMPVELALRHAECYPTGGGQKRSCSTALLGGEWLNNPSSYIDFQGYPGDGLDKTSSSQYYYQHHIRNDSGNTPVVYARIWRGDNRTVIQYWLYYYYNSWGYQGGMGGGAGLHEGDWEMVQVVLDGEQKPAYAVFAQHVALPLPYLNFNGASKKEWNDLARDTVDGDHPIVYPGLGSHASYFGPYLYLYAYDQTATVTTPLLHPAVYLLQPEGADRWVGYDGRWGQPGRLLAFQGGPPSPGNQGQKWSAPLAWAGGVEWDEFAGHNRGKVRAHVDAPCNVGLKIAGNDRRFGWIFSTYYEEISGGEYVVNETRGTRSAILHDTYKVNVAEYFVYITCPDDDTPSARLAAPRALTVEFYDATLDELVMARYTLPADWVPEATIGALALGDAGLELAVDRDNDGVADELVPPDEVITAPVVPPAGPGTAYIPSILR